MAVAPGDSTRTALATVGEYAVAFVVVGDAITLEHGVVDAIGEYDRIRMAVVREPTRHRGVVAFGEHATKTSLSGLGLRSVEI